MEQFSDLYLSITPPNLKLDSLTSRDRNEHLNDMSHLVEGVFDHNQRRCRFCGYQENAKIVRVLKSKAHAEEPPTMLMMIPLNGNPRDLSPGNCGVSCVFCQAPNSLNTIENQDSWCVVYLPGVPQYYLSWIARSVFLMNCIQSDFERRPNRSVLAPTDPDEAAAFQVILDALRAINTKMNDAKAAASRFPGFTDVSTLAQMLVDLALKNFAEYERRASLLAGFRIIPKACIDDDWSNFYKYRTLMIEATGFAGLRAFRDIALVARQTYTAVYDATFASGDPLKMEVEMGTKLPVDLEKSG